MLRGYKRNEALVNLDLVPANILEQVATMYDEYKLNERSKLFNYFIKNKLKNLMEHIGDF